MNEYVRITFTASRDMGDEETLPITDEDIARTLVYEDCGKLDRILWAIYTVEVEDITEAEADPDFQEDEDETPSWAINAQQDEREAMPSGLEAPARR